MSSRTDELRATRPWSSPSARSYAVADGRMGGDRRAGVDVGAERDREHHPGQHREAVDRGGGERRRLAAGELGVERVGIAEVDQGPPPVGRSRAGDPARPRPGLVSELAHCVPSSVGGPSLPGRRPACLRPVGRRVRQPSCATSSSSCSTQPVTSSRPLAGPRVLRRPLAQADARPAGEFEVVGRRTTSARERAAPARHRRTEPGAIMVRCRMPWSARSCWRAGRWARCATTCSRTGRPRTAVVPVEHPEVYGPDDP